jgi:protein-disulfide isomerase
MKTRWRWIFGAGVGAALLAMSSTGSAQTPQAPQTPQAAQPRQAPPPKDVVATVGNEVITMAELERLSATELASIDEQRHRVLDRKLAMIIAERLINAEAKRRGVSVEALLQAEVLSKMPPLTGEDVDAFIAQNRARLPANDPDLKSKVSDYLHRVQLAQRQEAFAVSLRGQLPVQVYLKAPEPVRVSIDPNIGFARGPREAPVSIVEFSDYHCPFCRTVVGTLKQLLAQYPDRVRWVFRDFPIAGLHPEAQAAHEAARCAGEQGKFWPYHDLLFERPPDVSPAALRALAAQVGVEAAAFGQCLDSRKYRGAVNADIEAGTKLGITGTPTFFINGAMLVGNQPLADFQRLIEAELARTAVKR